ncbi:MAG: adenylate kinase family protein [Rickettsiaceae bacterium]
MIFLFLGPPGSGKGTQAQILSDQFSCKHISVGEELRQIALNKGKNYEVIQEAVDSGKLVPSFVVKDLIMQYLSKNYTHLILDGYPRNLEQVDILNLILKNSKEGIGAIYFNINIDLLLQRIDGRISCAICHKIYHKKNNPPKINGICDHCGSDQLIHRKDDNPEILKNRMKEYEKSMHQVIQYYKNLGLCSSIDANKNPKQITQELLDLMFGDK